MIVMIAGRQRRFPDVVLANDALILEGNRRGRLQRIKEDPDDNGGLGPEPRRQVENERIIEMHCLACGVGIRHPGYCRRCTKLQKLP